MDGGDSDRSMAVGGSMASAEDAAGLVSSEDAGASDNVEAGIALQASEQVALLFPNPPIPGDVLDSLGMISAAEVGAPDSLGRVPVSLVDGRRLLWYPPKEGKPGGTFREGGRLVRGLKPSPEVGGAPRFDQASASRAGRNRVEAARARVREELAAVVPELLKSAKNGGLGVKLPKGKVDSVEAFALMVGELVRMAHKGGKGDADTMRKVLDYVDRLGDITGTASGASGSGGAGELPAASAALAVLIAAADQVARERGLGVPDVVDATWKPIT